MIFQNEIRLEQQNAFIKYHKNLLKCFELLST